MGRVTQVFGTPRELQGAYDFLEEGHAKAGPIVEATGVECVRRAGHRQNVIVAVDGSSVSVVDRTGKKELGSLGSYVGHGCGVKMINALAIGLDGTTVGLVDQQYWHRVSDASRAARAGAIKKKRNRKAPAAAKETQHWLDAIDASERRFKAHADHVGRIYVLDREADSRDLLAKLGETGQGFIVRSSWTSDASRSRDPRSAASALVSSSLPAPGRREVPIAGTAKVRHAQLVWSRGATAVTCSCALSTVEEPYSARAFTSCRRARSWNDPGRREVARVDVAHQPRRQQPPSCPGPRARLPYAALADRRSPQAVENRRMQRRIRCSFEAPTP